VTANAASSAPPPLDPEHEHENSAARQTEEFLANLAYDVHNEDYDGYESPDDETVHTTANAVFVSLEEQLLVNLEYGTPPPIGNWDNEIIVISANMISGDDLLILPQKESVVLSSSSGTEESTRLSPKQSNFFKELLSRPRPTPSPPAVAEVPLSYAEVHKANLLNETDLNRHEALIYRPGCSPSELRSSV
jgi:hypothetical protein